LKVADIRKYAEVQEYTEDMRISRGLNEDDPRKSIKKARRCFIAMKPQEWPCDAES
jgi:hypothetical protein